MPGKDGTGPMGLGALTGRGLGVCSGAKSTTIGLGKGPRVGRYPLGKEILSMDVDSDTRKKLLQERRRILENQLKVIDKELEK